MQRLAGERRRSNTFQSEPFGTPAVKFSMPLTETVLQRYVDAAPFVPSGTDELTQRCEKILTLQAMGLATRLRHIGCKTAVVGLSGGLDSTLALIVMVHAFRICGLDPAGMLAVTMPCFGTTDRTYQNACWRKPMGQPCGKCRFRTASGSTSLILDTTNPSTMSHMKIRRHGNGHRY